MTDEARGNGRIDTLIREVARVSEICRHLEQVAGTLPELATQVDRIGVIVSGMVEQRKDAKRAFYGAVVAAIGAVATAIFTLLKG